MSHQSKPDKDYFGFFFVSLMLIPLSVGLIYIGVKELNGTPETKGSLMGLVGIGVGLILLKVYFDVMRKDKDTPTSDSDSAMVEAIRTANRVACDFASCVENISPIAIYDVAILPHPKDHIVKCCQLWIGVCRNAEQLAGWIVIYPILSQFQPGVGKQPLGLNVEAINKASNAGVSVEELARMSLSHPQPSPELKTKVEREFCEMVTWVTDAVSQRLVQLSH
ncbi:MAG: hypothetical protein GC162_12625 [Planctomycetes bacterium]|nr:hypothetical protein [Planctomycetota bacterium]